MGTINPPNVLKTQHSIRAYVSVQCKKKKTHLISRHFKQEIRINSNPKFRFLPQNNHSKSSLQPFWDVKSCPWESGS